MRGWTALISKDWKLVLRNRLLLVVLIVYPFLIMGVIGAAFYDVGRPVPIGLVNLDRAEVGDVIWMGGEAEKTSRITGRFSMRADEAVEFEGEEQALSALDEGEVDALLVVVEEEEEGETTRWTGAVTSEGMGEVMIDDLEYLVETVCDYANAGEALESLRQGENNVLMALRMEEYPYLGETIWLEGEHYDASSLVKRYGEDVTEIEEYAMESQARGDLKEGRIDAIIVLPRAFIHKLKTLEEIAGVRVILDQSNLVKSEFAETSIRGFLSRVNEEITESKMEAVVAGLYVLVGGGDFFGTEIVGLDQVRDDLIEIKEALEGRPELEETVDIGIDLADTVIEDIEDAAAYLEATALPIDLSISSVVGRRLSAKDAVVPSLIALSILWTGILCGAILMVVEEEERMRSRLRLTEMGPFALVGSKLVLATAVVFLQSAVMLFMAIAVFGAFASNAPLALLVIAAASASSIGIGLVIAAFARQVAGAVILSVLVAFPLIFMTGAVFPLSQMPTFMQWIARAIPLTYAIEALTGVMLRGEPLSGVAWQIGALVAFGVALLALGSALVRRRGA
ncbi:MAG: ABC transporter permease [Actinomycetota bacterium]|nr:ABC transporter permease [Actinomycetota bacterium]